KTAAFRNELEFLILGHRDPTSGPPDPDALFAELRMGSGPEGFEPFRPRLVQVGDDPQFRPITDDQPFLAGNVRHILSLAQVRQLFALAAGALALAGAAVWATLRRRADPRIPGRPFAAVAGLALLVGANFLVVEHLLVL